MMQRLGFRVFLALLLLQMPMALPDFAAAAQGAMQQSMPADGPHCHETAADEASCDDRGCVFCGLAQPAQAPRLDTFLAHLLYALNDPAPATPRVEQPVELRPPKHPRFA